MSVVVVSEDSRQRAALGRLVRRRGYDCLELPSEAGLSDLLGEGIHPGLLILDLDLCGRSGLEILRRLRGHGMELPVLAVSAVDDAGQVVEAARLGAFAYLIKPLDASDVIAALEESLGPTGPLQSAHLALPDHGAMRQVREALDRVVEADVNVLIRGETGVGKEVLAREIHARSSRCDRPFEKVHCAALPRQLLESELFGYEKGAFTGAYASRAGRLEAADGGTLFLDEIGEMSADLQAKLLHALQDGSFVRIGDNVERKVDVRVICATHRPLEKMIEEGSFRQDLYFRINVLEITIPPLRERRDEMVRLFDTFLLRNSQRWGKPLPPISKALREELLRYPFPGNIRELENMAKRLVALQDPEGLLREIRGLNGSTEAAREAMQRVIAELEQTAGDVPLLEVGRRAASEAEKHILGRVLSMTDWNRKKAARMLNVSYSTLLQKIRACGLQAPDVEGCRTTDGSGTHAA